MLGQELSDPHGVEHGGDMKGMGLLDISTVFEEQKIRTRTVGKLSGVTEIFSSLSGLEYDGYEIHMGISGTNANIVNKGNVYGTYIHGIFDRDEITKAVISALLRMKGIEDISVDAKNIEQFKDEQYDLLADIVRESLDMDYVYKVLNEGVNI